LTGILIFLIIHVHDLAVCVSLTPLLYKEDAIKRKSRLKKQEEILDAIREKVLDESQNLKEQREQLLAEKANLDALQEMTDLPIKRIKQIASQVKAEYKRKESSQKNLASSIIGLSVKAAVIAVISYFIANAIISGIKAHRENVAKQDYYKLSRDYLKLVNAVDSANLEMVKYHVNEEKIPVDLEGISHNTALMYAVEEGHTDILNFLLESGADVLIKNKDGKMALDLADEGPNIAVRQIVGRAVVDETPEQSPIRKLWENKVSYSQKSFMKVLEKRDIDSIKLFLAADEGRFAQSWDDDGIRKAAELGYSDVVGLLFDKGQDIRPVSKNLALLRASEEGHIDIIDILLKKGADVNFRLDGSATDPEDGFTPLMWALWSDNAACEHLLKKGADPNAMGSYHLIPTIMLPIYFVQNFRLTDERLNQLRLLIKYGADVNKPDSYGTTPLDYAWSLRSSEARPIAKVLIEAGADIPLTEGSFRELVFINHVENVKLFLEKGMDPNLQGFEHYDEETTALIKSVMLGFYDIAELLIKYGADVNYKTPDYKKSALLMAVVNEDLKMLKLLLDNGALVTDEVDVRIEKYYSYANYEPKNTIKALIKKAKR